MNTMIGVCNSNIILILHIILILCQVIQGCVLGLPIGKSRNSVFLKLVPGFSRFWIHAALTFMLSEIRAEVLSLAKDWYKSLRTRLEGRRTVYSPLLNFRKNPNKESDFDKDLYTILIKSELATLILHFAEAAVV